MKEIKAWAVVRYELSVVKRDPWLALAVAAYCIGWLAYVVFLVLNASASCA